MASDKIYDLSWKETGFGKKLELLAEAGALMREQLRERKCADAYFGFAHACFTIANSARMQFPAALHARRWRIPRLVGFAVAWVPLGAWCMFRMLPCSLKGVRAAGGYARMTPEQCDMHQSVLRAYRRYAEAGKCIDVGLAKNPAPHVRGLLLVGATDIAWHKRDWKKTSTLCALAIECARHCEESNPDDASRIFRNCARFADCLGWSGEFNGTQLRNNAQRLAESIGAKDQLAKQGLFG